jgi:hypothetical protein
MGESGDYEGGTELEPSIRPRVVDEAEEVLGSYHRLLLGSGFAAGATAVMSPLVFGVEVPAEFLIMVFALLGILFLAPITREPRLARDVLRRWDILRVERALNAELGTDPRVEVAEAMADRVVRHPSVDEGVRDRTRMLVRRLKLLLNDLRRIEWLLQTRTVGAGSTNGRSISDLQDVLDARVAGVLGQLSEIHRTVVLRDAAALGRVLAAADDLLRELEAEREVDRLLTQAEGRTRAVDLTGSQGD